MSDTDQERRQAALDAERQHGTPPSWNQPIMSAPKE